MTQAKIARLDDRGAVSVTGPDAFQLLQGLVTNNLDGLDTRPDAMALAAPTRHAGLLSPQGKILFEFFCARTPRGFVLDVASDKTADLVKRLSMYKLRATVDIKGTSEQFVCLALWGPDAVSSCPMTGAIRFRDPRHPDLGYRTLAEASIAADVTSATTGTNEAPEAYHAHRIALGVPEGGKDYDFGDAYPHEADFDLFNGVSFSKGCYVGQEIVARMQHKTVVRKRVVKVSSFKTPLPSGRPEIMAGNIPIGRLGSIDGVHGLAMLRLDRADEAKAEGTPLTVAGIEIGYSLPECRTEPAQV